ncbi:MAG: hypothetical protein IPH44_40605 [Myxococcales bacterium]|nr:hypothetical protein [Myxococcales bacterium]MBK7192344.1 hypothetical protein [Myxococcales bacterium]MBP6844316.1 hypothetical protein [Kofleriaceae bacterium]
MPPRCLLVSSALLAAVAAVAHAQPTPRAIPPVPTIASLVASIDADPDPLHADYTPAVWALCGHGLDGARAVLSLLDAADPMTRMHASRALECAVAAWFGVRRGQTEDPRSGATRRFEAAWMANGPYAWDGPPAARRAARDRWAAWLTAHANAAPPPPDQPSTAAIHAALAPLLPAAQACVTGGGRVTAAITFSSAGAVRRVRVGGASRADARCVERALASARVPRFTKRTSTLMIGVTR